VAQHPAEKQPQKPNLFQPLSVPGAQFGGALLQQDQAMTARRHLYDKLAVNYLAFIKLAAIRIRLRAYESTP
jgi:transposase